ncbi:amino acid/amide ABC transporter membrane protein 1, HAAT family (TC 3.A.1.4.-) [Enhydrobacter aerosaccus]|uniref:Amino acid/amide ABC transporter membrane protein 1, HAAT family (TC 3.A.1.4.-) n=1 Tax=Enhydrobacter aerosaccus TaxID=225324 RepID=A0A1T4TFS8_9HYPH|nr:branched-chain amino acid ABC transporter permease [Enhydrobacter aerosaccus]SKA39282.1 amino acid/amide ABC transporter membrane protein 1, HAAT family (TC 3.A.1.4.-) [Enhydrobacter aerosaccus]
MDLALIIALDVVNGAASLVLLCLGLAIIFGMMRVINLAHGEFVMLGAYATVISANAGLNIWIAMLVVAPVFVGVVGIVIERCLIRFLYGRLVDTMLATWGLSLLIVGLVTTLYGNTIKGVPTPLGGFSVGAYKSSYYTLFLAAVALIMLALVYVVMRRTRFGLVARATMQNPGMAATLGVNPSRIYMMSFGIGSAITGLAGGLLAPVSGVVPTMGAAYVAKAFITVVGGGSAILAGTASSSALFGLINQLGSYFTTPVFGEVILFISAIILIRILPQGISERFFKGSL